MPNPAAYDLDFRPATYWSADDPAASHVEPDDREDPPRYPDEVSIVTILIDSVLGDWVSLRARREDGSIRYRIVAEWEGDDDSIDDGASLMIPGIGESQEPLTLGQIIESMESSSYSDRESNREYEGLGLIACCRTGLGFPFPESREEREAGRGFVQVRSNFYPQLEAYYLEVEQEWIDAAPERDDSV